jgi:hypothetical protein
MNDLSILNLEKNKSLLEIDTYVSGGKFVKFHIKLNRGFVLQR